MHNSTAAKSRDIGKVGNLSHYDIAFTLTLPGLQIEPVKAEAVSTTYSRGQRLKRPGPRKVNRKIEAVPRNVMDTVITRRVKRYN